MTLVRADPDGHRPLCRCCGKQLPKNSSVVWVERHRSTLHKPTKYSSYVYVNEDNHPRTKEDCRQWSNFPILSISRGVYLNSVLRSDLVHSFRVWPDNMYVAHYGYFCSNHCAGCWAEVAARALPNAHSVAYQDAKRAQRGEKPK